MLVRDFLTNEILAPHGDLLLTDFKPEGLLLVNENECIYIVNEYKTRWEPEPYERSIFFKMIEKHHINKNDDGFFVIPYEYIVNYMNT